MLTNEQSPISDLLEFEDYGMVFTLKKFVITLLRVALIADFGKETENSSEKLHLLIERMEMSDGFISPANLVCRSNTTLNN